MKLPSNRWRNVLSAAYDTLAAGACFVAALQLRWPDALWHNTQHYLLNGTAGAAACMLLMVLYTRLYRRVWRYVSLKDITTMLRVCGATMLVFYGGFFLASRLELLPRTVPLIHALLLLAVMIAPRVLSRIWHERRLSLPESQQIPVLLIGATDEAETFIRESMRHRGFPYRVVGLVGTDDKSAGRTIHHVKIYGTLKDIPAILRKLRRKGNAAQRLILATDRLDGSAVSELLKTADAETISLARMPRLSDLNAQGAGALHEIKPIEVEDLLGRAQVKLNLEAMRELITGQVILVTGAGGSIGSELVRQLAGFKPRRIVLLEQSEYALYRIERELREDFPDLARRALLGDVRDAERLTQLFAQHRPNIVFHAAALKHVPLCENNISEAVLTNVIGTQCVADACIAANVGLMVQISTDKAVNPTNIMGACKRLGESYAQALGQSQSTTRFITVRFGNVLGSTGSVVPQFQRQLQRGGPITVTHPEMTRYFMTIREAVRLVIQAASLQSPMQAAPIYVLEMGEPVKIDDLARQMIRLAGLRPEHDIEISYTGLRAGEKLHEELFYETEALQSTQNASIMLASAREVALKPLAKQCMQLAKLAAKHEDAQLKALLEVVVPEYQPEQSTKETA
jgi:FlaA1/EpsC-like NDP-sugar epimerase